MVEKSSLLDQVAARCSDPEEGADRPFWAMATLISRELAIIPNHVLAGSYGDSDPIPKLALHFDRWPTPITILATVVARDPAIDTAVLELDEPAPVELPPLVGAGPLSPGAQCESLYILPSYPDGVYVTGTFVRRRTIEGIEHLQLEMEMPRSVGAGASGAPVLIDQRLVGIIAGSDEKAWYALPIDTMAAITVLAPILQLPIPKAAQAAGAVDVEPIQKTAQADVEPILKTAQAAGAADLDEAALFQHLSPSSRRALGVADGLRRALGQDRVHMEHLIVGLYDKEDGPTQKLFERANITADRLPSLIAEAVETTLPPRDRYTATELTALPPLSAHARQALIAARDVAAEHQSADRIQSRHLLYGALSVDDCGVIKTLHKHGLSKEGIDLRPDGAAAAPSDAGQAALPALRTAIAGFQSDNPAGEDLLGITKEVNALCAIIAAGDVQPPLSIGLFGDWGSGKSFFMKKMRERIERLKVVARRAQGESAFCPNIVQLEFNAWHFIDTNLWASLTAEIFERLDEALAVRPEIDVEQERQRLLADTASSRYVLAEELRRKEVAEAELQQSEQRLKQLQDEASFAASLSVLDVLRSTHRLAMQQPEVSTKIDDAVNELNLGQAGAATQQTKDQLIELHGLMGRAVALWLSIQNPKHRRVWVVALLALVIVPFAVSWLLQFALANRIDQAISNAVGLILGILASLSPFIGRAKRAIESIEQARRSSQAIVDQERQRRVAELEQKRQQIQQQVTVAQQQVEQASDRVKKLEQDLDSLRADRQMSNFIKQRHLSTDYTAHLGVIARARNDFEQLSTLLEQVRQQAAEQAARRRQAEESEGAVEQNGPAGPALDLPQIDRIVLYIDDLDRCPEDKVVDVLQAVHLLLAFPLFVVVVGVDSRWLLHSLQQHTKVFQASRDGEAGVSDEEDRHWQSTPLNYLEKIFQIPFALRPMERGGFGELIDNLTTLRSEAPQRRTSHRAPSAAGAAAGADGGVSRTAGQNGPMGGTQAAGMAASGANGTEGSEPRGEQAPAAADAGASREADAAKSQTPEQAAAAETGARQASAPVGRQADETTIDPNPHLLSLSDQERAYMKQLYSLIPSPRAAKRFVNVYRLLRASLDGHQEVAFIGDADQGQYQAVLLLLAILVGYPAEATEILRDLLEQEQDQTWWSFIDQYAGEARPSIPGTTATTADTAGQFETERWQELLEKLGNLRSLISEHRPCQDFITWAPEIARYSFQSGRVMLSQYEQRSP